MDKETHSYKLQPTRGEVVSQLLKYGIQPTQQRVEIAQLLFERPQHLSAEQIIAVINHRGVGVSKATVYNTLGLLARKGLIQEVIVDPNRVFYDTTVKPHYHFYNVDTGALTDIEAHQLSFDVYPELPDGTVPEGIDVIIRVKQSKD